MPVSEKGELLNPKFTEYVQKLFSTSTSWSYLYAKYQDPSQSRSSDIVHKVAPIQNTYVRKRGITQWKIY